MAEKDAHLSRRDFLATAAAAGAGALLGAGCGDDEPPVSPDPTDPPGEPAPVGEGMPRRPFGASGIDVPILSLGGSIDTINGQLVLRQAVKDGVLYWDTAERYGKGGSETGMGAFLRDNPDTRERMFLVTKSHKPLADLTRGLEDSLERLQTDYVDLFFLHGVSDPDRLDDEAKLWAGQMKRAGKIKLFGFSTHQNMTECLARAAEVGWVDGIMTTYNYRVKTLDDANDGALTAAIDACHEAGIGLTAMKTQAQAQRPGAGRYANVDAEAAAALVEAFIDSGYTPEQAALKWVWQDERFASICSRMPNMAILSANVAAALNKTDLTADETASLRGYAEATASSYCAGCGSICRQAIGDQVPVNDVLRYLMYYDGYGQADEARELFAALPAAVRRALAGVDYSEAEAHCPQHIPIGRMMKQAADVLT